MNIPKKATTLAEAINVFDSRRPLMTKAELDAFYVERPPERLDEMGQMKVLLQSLTKPGKFLFTGPRGSGKSTELYRLVGERGIRSEFFVIHFSVTKSLNPSNLHFTDLVLGIANQLLATATDKDILTKDITQIIREDLLDDVFRWFDTTLLKDIPLRARDHFENATITAKVNLLAVELESKFRVEPATRDVIRSRLEKNMERLLEDIKFMADDIRRKIGRQTLIIVEDIDKLDREVARKLYLNHAATLTRPATHVIYTFPISLRYTNDYNQISRNFDETYPLPNIKINNRNGDPHPTGRDMLRRMVLERIEADLIEPPALERLVEMSGGVPLILIDLTQRAVVHTLASNHSRVGLENVDASIYKERRDYQAILTAEQLDLLRRRQEDKAMRNNTPDLECLHNLSLLEYTNNEAWRDVNPIVNQLLDNDNAD